MFVSALALRELGDPILHGVGDFTVGLWPRVLMLTKRRGLQCAGASALYDFDSRVHKIQADAVR